MDQFRAALDRLGGLYQTLIDDAEAAFADYRASNSPHSRRQFVRAAFAMVDGVTYAMKQVAHASHLDRTAVFSPRELALLDEEVYDLNHSGEVVSRPANLPLLRNIRFAFASLAKAHGCSYTLPIHEHEWELLGRASKIRNRLMHPKQLSDLEVTDEDLHHVRKSYGWFASNAYQALESGQAAVHKEILKLKRRKRSFERQLDRRRDRKAEIPGGERRSVAVSPNRRPRARPAKGPAGPIPGR